MRISTKLALWLVARHRISISFLSFLLQDTRCLTRLSVYFHSGGPGKPGMPGLAGQPGAPGRDIYAVLETASDEQHVRVKLANQATDYAIPLLFRSDGGVGASGGNGGIGGMSHISASSFCAIFFLQFLT